MPFGFHGSNKEEHKLDSPPIKRPHACIFTFNVQILLAIRYF